MTHLIYQHYNAKNSKIKFWKSISLVFFNIKIFQDYILNIKYSIKSIIRKGKVYGTTMIRGCLPPTFSAWARRELERFADQMEESVHRTRHCTNVEEKAIIEKKKIQIKCHLDLAIKEKLSLVSCDQTFWHKVLYLAQIQNFSVA